IASCQAYVGLRPHASNCVSITEQEFGASFDALDSLCYNALAWQIGGPADRLAPLLGGKGH
ncbi:MAG TPA: hypothetical protein VLY63_10480, partial [Anaerolineae bacterium]|nr:hypothetical protein [Anaerolineae bacterium]